MRIDDNWKETRVLAEDIEELLGVPKETTEIYLKSLENLIVHKFLEIVSDEDFQGKDCQVELPYLGSLVISVDEDNKMTTNFVVRNTFYRKLKSAYFQKKSPLTEQCAEVLGKDLVERYRQGGIDDE